MDVNNFVYFALLLASLAYPLAQSFEWRLQLWKKWKYFFPGLIITAAVFLVWDVYFAYEGVWGFNQRYVTGLFFLKLPVEEWLFFLVIPYCCFFIYEVLNHYFPRIRDHQFMLPFHWFFAILLLAGGIWNIDKVYTSVAFLTAGVVLSVIGLLPFFRPWLYRFWSAYFVSIIPFLLVNGILTALPVVTYNPAENLGLRINTIPAEDFIYLLTLLFMNFAFFEWFRKRWEKAV